MKVIGKSVNGYIVSVDGDEMRMMRLAMGLAEKAELGDAMDVGPVLDRLTVLKKRAAEGGLAEKLESAAAAVRKLAEIVER